MMDNASDFTEDFPGCARRPIQKPVGRHYTLGNGVVMFEDENCTNALPGRLLRSSQVVA
jgi:hypothetical protein